METRFRWALAIALPLHNVIATAAQASKGAIEATAGIIAWDMMQYYKGNLSGGTPGILPGPPPGGDYYWWEGGAMWGTLIDYWALTGDTSYNTVIMDSMQWQVGEDDDYQPRNHTLSLGNDDQGFWGMSAMLAAEMKFPDPPSDKPQWLALAQAVFNTQADPIRHDDECGGGLRWQIPRTNPGYNYKNSIANGCFFNLGARLYRFTGNQTYADWAIKTWDWMENIGLIDPSSYAIYDGADTPLCKKINIYQFSYNNGIFAQGAAFMYNATQDPVWKNRTERLVNYGLKTFFPKGVAIEISCETVDKCTTDMFTFKGFMHRWYSVITQMVPSTAQAVVPILKTSANAAIKQCTGGALGRQCGFKWDSGVYDGKTGAGQQMSVLGAVLSQLARTSAKPPVTANTGGTSKGNPNAGSRGNRPLGQGRPITAADKAGAGIVTVIVLFLASAIFASMLIGE
ncbi:hypothetical protein HIM_08884 [Hirsutella minnesotensis 3608]|uniref:Mannan endo-1,6-alpha-mannosidase n=1 Tax=Hirsutella minnesotensis 3608 TaxID=1043627 RepID=A0A0F7ZY27_9HYPO|nr:hypothetical protein HIM_08884 [Hirsutella minnesotensis 3608]